MYLLVHFSFKAIHKLIYKIYLYINAYDMYDESFLVSKQHTLQVNCQA